LINEKIIVTAPVAHADLIRAAIGKAGGGQVGKYSFCSFSVRGIGRFLPNDGANPAIGEVGKLEEVEEDRIEITVSDELVDTVVSAIRAVHPYEEPVIDIYTLTR